MSFILQKDKAVTVKSIVIINLVINFNCIIRLMLYDFFYFCMSLVSGMVDTIAVTSSYHLIQIKGLINALKNSDCENFGKLEGTTFEGIHFY